MHYLNLCKTVMFSIIMKYLHFATRLHYTDVQPLQCQTLIMCREKRKLFSKQWYPYHFVANKFWKMSLLWFLKTNGFNRYRKTKWKYTNPVTSVRNFCKQNTLRRKFCFRILFSCHVWLRMAWTWAEHCGHSLFSCYHILNQCFFQSVHSHSEWNYHSDSF